MGNWLIIVQNYMSLLNRLLCDFSYMISLMLAVYFYYWFSFSYLTDNFSRQRYPYHLCTDLFYDYINTKDWRSCTVFWYVTLHSHLDLQTFLYKIKKPTWLSFKLTVFNLGITVLFSLLMVHNIYCNF